MYLQYKKYVIICENDETKQLGNFSSVCIKLLKYQGNVNQLLDDYRDTNGLLLERRF